MESTSQNKCLMAAIILSAIAYSGSIVVNALVNVPGVSPFNYTVGDLSHKYETEITPADATFSIWGLIYIWQLALVVYCCTLLCRKSDNQPLYVNPGFIPLSFFLSYIVNTIGNPGWLIVWLTEQLELSWAVLGLCLLSLVISLWTAVSKLDQVGAEMVKKGLQGDIWATRIVVHNGIALYLGWVSCATIINGIVVMHYVAGVAMDTCCFAALAALMAIVALWFVIETFFADRQLRYVFGQYIAYMAAAVGSYVKNYQAENPVSPLLQYLLILVTILTGLKLIIMIARSLIQGPIDYKTRAKLC